jgi:hypothetical protein
MRLNKLVKKISETKEIQSHPPVLMDIGASGKLNSVWKKIAPFSICIAFDADKREFDYIEKESVFKKQFVFNKIVVASSTKTTASFYLTENPYCSSLLEPDLESLKPFHYSDLFQIKQTIEMDVIELKNVLIQLNIDTVDWFKTDTQGTDLRLYQSLKEEQQNKILILEFEPGFIDAYIGEDKIVDVLNYMKLKPYFLLNMTIKGGLRILNASFNSIFKGKAAKKMASHTLKKTPGWAEMIYMNTLKAETFTTREFMLSWLFATLQNHHDVAFSYAEKACEKYSEPLFIELKKHSTSRLKNNAFSWNAFVEVVNILYNKHIAGN